MNQQTLRTLTASEASVKIMGRKRLKDAANVARISVAVSDMKKRSELLGPTPERLAKGDIKKVEPEENERKSSVRYGPKKNVVDEYHKKWDQLSETAFRRLIDDSSGADVTGVTINYYAAGGNTASSKLGGLGNAHWKKVEKYTRFNYAMDRLPSRARRVIEWVILPRDDREAMTELEDIGRWLFPHFKDHRSLRMLALGYIIAIGDKLVSLYVHCDMEASVQRRIKNEREIS